MLSHASNSLQTGTIFTYHALSNAGFKFVWTSFSVVRTEQDY